MNPYLPSTPAERDAMLQAIGAESLEELLAQIPSGLRWNPKPGSGEVAEPLRHPLSELELTLEARERAAKNHALMTRSSFVGAGCYRHFIPSIVAQLATRAEFLTAYTPYQPEASQGVLQATFEFQTLIAQLTGMEIANAGIYDGATALAEAVCMGINIKPEANRIVLAGGIHPDFRAVVHTHLDGMGPEVVEVPSDGGRIDPAAWKAALGPAGTTAVAVFQSPNFFGGIEDGAKLVAAAKEAGAVSVVVFNPTALGVLATPGEWGADIAVGEGQPLGLAPAGGGETVGLFASKKEYMWKMPGRLVGLTRDRQGRRAYVLTLQTREQHIRRAKATSNICTNHALFAIMSTVYMSVLGPRGLRELATICARRADYARRKLAKVPGVKLAHPEVPVFHEFVIEVPEDAEVFAAHLEEHHNISPGYPLGKKFASMKNSLLVCTTELATEADIDRLVAAVDQTIREDAVSGGKK